MIDALWRSSKDEGSIILKMKFMTSNGGSIQVVEGPMISTREEITNVGNRSLGKREIGSKLLFKKELGSKSLAKKEHVQFPS